MSTKTTETCVNSSCKRKFKLVETGGSFGGGVEYASYDCPYCGHHFVSRSSGHFEAQPIKKK